MFKLEKSGSCGIALLESSNVSDQDEGYTIASPLLFIFIRLVSSTNLLVDILRHQDKNIFDCITSL
jgi:hypothetical protein